MNLKSFPCSLKNFANILFLLYKSYDRLYENFFLVFFYPMKYDPISFFLLTLIFQASTTTLFYNLSEYEVIYIILL